MRIYASRPSLLRPPRAPAPRARGRGRSSRPRRWPRGRRVFPTTIAIFCKAAPTLLAAPIVVQPKPGGARRELSRLCDVRAWVSRPCSFHSIHSAGNAMLLPSTPPHPRRSPHLFSPTNTLSLWQTAVSLLVSSVFRCKVNLRPRSKVYPTVNIKQFGRTWHVCRSEW